METMQIVLDKELLVATDRAARRTKRNRSALVRDALREHLRKLEIRAQEEREREGYAKHPQSEAEALLWERAAR
jgi:metal-responsive CopG/Arc/MetJ family transcriptional regulator